MRYIKIKMNVDEQNYYFVERRIKILLNQLQEPSFYKIHSWKFVE